MKKTKKGLVLEVHRRTCSIRLDDSEIISATYRTAVVHELGEFPAVGDRVVVGFTESTDNKGAYSLLRVLPRTSALKRPGPRDRFRKELTLAANIDQVVMSLPFHTSFQLWLCGSFSTGGQSLQPAPRRMGPLTNGSGGRDPLRIENS
jgi:putative ribosome biogenesis GTPase RsgA